MRRLRILVLMHPDFVPPDSSDGYTAQEINEWKTEYDVVSTLRAAGHDVRPLGVQEEIKPMRDAIESSSRTWSSRCWRNSTTRRLRPAHRELSRADEGPLYRVQSARPDPGARQGFVQDAGASSPDRGAGLRRVPDAPQGQTADASCAAADRQEPEHGWILRHLAGVDRRYRREARGARRLHPRAGRNRRHRRAVHRGTRALCRRARQQPVARSAGLGIEIRQHGRPQRTAHRHREGQARYRLSGEASASSTGRRRTWRRK